MVHFRTFLYCFRRCIAAGVGVLIGAWLAWAHPKLEEEANRGLDSYTAHAQARLDAL